MSATERFCWPCWPVLGLAEMSDGVPAVMVRALGSPAISAPVVSVTLRLPVGVAASISIMAVAAVGEVTVRAVTVTPAPKSAAVVPCTQFVY